MATRKKPTALAKYESSKTTPKITLTDAEKLKIVSGVVGYSLIAATHPQGFLAGLGQIARDRVELEEYRTSKRKKKDIP